MREFYSGEPYDWKKGDIAATARKWRKHNIITTGAAEKQPLPFVDLWCCFEDSSFSALCVLDCRNGIWAVAGQGEGKKGDSFATRYFPRLPLNGNSARIPERFSRLNGWIFFAKFCASKTWQEGKARGKIENGMALLFKILNRKCSSPLIFRNFLSKIFRKSKMGYAPWLKIFGEKFQSKMCYAPWFSEISSEIFRKPKMGYAPHPLRWRSAPSPERGRLEIRQ